ncbi:MAG: zf-HC2 domain-containing protein [Calditrichaeota bacterium]|nr:zf-HC2 domain-containing protein [Calditrichota bacterium]
MEHKEIRKKLLSYIDNELPPDEIAEIQLHLEQCAQCRKDIQLLSGVWNLPQSKRQMQPSPFLWNKISAQLEEKRQTGQSIHKVTKFIRQMAKPALTAAVIIIGVFIGIKIGHRMSRAQLSSQQITIISVQSQDEFGLENFRILPSSSLAGELAVFMDFENE